MTDAGDQKLHALRYQAKGAETVLIYYTAIDQDGEHAQNTFCRVRRVEDFFCVHQMS